MAHAQSRRMVGIAQVLGAGLGFGFLGIFGKLAFASGLSMGELLTYRFLAASFLLAGGLWFFWRDRLRISRTQLLSCALLGVLGYAVFSTFYFKSIEGVSVSLAALILYTYPIMVVVGARLAFKERLTSGQIFALPTTLLGLFLLLYGETSARSPLYILAGLAAALCYAIYILVSSRVQRNVDPLTSGLYVIAFAAIGLAAIHHPDPTRLFHLSINQTLIIFGIAVISTIGPLTLFLSGLQKLGNSEASILCTIEPFTAAIAGAAIFNERLSPLQMTGGILILLSLGAVVFSRQSSRS